MQCPTRSFVSRIDGGAPVITPIYKRWTRERSPPELYNHGFENMESMGAVYSRVSSHIFGDWNACGEPSCVRLVEIRSVSRVCALSPDNNSSDGTFLWNDVCHALCDYFVYFTDRLLSILLPLPLKENAA